MPVWTYFNDPGALEPLAAGLPGAEMLPGSFLSL